jgi:hypothetical protein
LGRRNVEGKGVGKIMKKRILKEIGEIGVESLKIVGEFVLDATGWFIMEVARGLGLEEPIEYPQDYTGQGNIICEWGITEIPKEETKILEPSEKTIRNTEVVYEQKQARKRQNKPTYIKPLTYEGEFRNNPFSRTQLYTRDGLYFSDGSV